MSLLGVITAWPWGLQAVRNGCPKVLPVAREINERAENPGGDPMLPRQGHGCGTGLVVKASNFRSRFNNLSRISNCFVISLALILSVVMPRVLDPKIAASSVKQAAETLSF
jgi:hypothetical protein